MQHMNHGHGRVWEVEIEKLVDARGMTRDGSSSPVTVLSSPLYFVFHSAFLVSPQPRFYISPFFASRISTFKTMETARIALQT